MKLYLCPVTYSDSPKKRACYSVGADTHLPDTDLIVPAGFEFDGASIPPLLWPVLGSPFDPRFMWAALWHDWAYSTHLIERKAADELFRRLLIENGVSERRAQWMYAGVRVGGNVSWDDSPEDVAYMAWLRELIIADGRDLNDYGLA